MTATACGDQARGTCVSEPQLSPVSAIESRKSIGLLHVSVVLLLFLAS
jgi:hypothetical protein